MVLDKCKEGFHSSWSKFISLFFNIWWLLFDFIEMQMVCPMRAVLSYVFKHAEILHVSWTWLFLECSWPKQIRDLIFGMLTRAAVFKSQLFLWNFKKSSETKLVGKCLWTLFGVSSFEKGYFSSRRWQWN